jgi:hypothetical protein
MASRGEVADQSGQGCRKVIQSSFVVFADCSIISSASFQSCKGGDMACVRGPLGAYGVAMRGERSDGHDPAED